MTRASKRSKKTKCQLWVISDVLSTRLACPLCPRSRCIAVSHAQCNMLCQTVRASRPEAQGVVRCATLSALPRAGPRVCRVRPERSGPRTMDRQMAGRGRLRTPRVLRQRRPGFPRPRSPVPRMRLEPRAATVGGPAYPRGRRDGALTSAGQEPNSVRPHDIGIRCHESGTTPCPSVRRLINS